MGADHHRAPNGHGFGNRDAKALVRRGEHEDGGSLEQRPLLLAGDGTRKGDSIYELCGCDDRGEPGSDTLVVGPSNDQMRRWEFFGRPRK